MANFLHHTNCTACGSTDNKGIYDDGSEWCFGCGFYKKPTGFPKPAPSKKKTATLILPNDASIAIPDAPYKWLLEYGLTKTEIRDNNIMFSDSRKLLIFPDYDKQGDLLMWQGRYFGSIINHPKYVTFGNKDHITLCDAECFPNSPGWDGPSSDTVVVVEDKISAIKVGRLLPANPLYGSTMSLEHATRLAKAFSKCILWLDSDKYRESLKQARTLSIVFKEGIQVITSDLDPKAYDEITLAMKLGLVV